MGFATLAVTSEKAEDKKDEARLFPKSKPLPMQMHPCLRAFSQPSHKWLLKFVKYIFWAASLQYKTPPWIQASHTLTKENLDLANILRGSPVFATPSQNLTLTLFFTSKT